MPPSTFRLKSSAGALLESSMSSRMRSAASSGAYTVLNPALSWQLLCFTAECVVILSQAMTAPGSDSYWIGVLVGVDQGSVAKFINLHA